MVNDEPVIRSRVIEKPDGSFEWSLWVEEPGQELRSLADGVAVDPTDAYRQIGAVIAAEFPEAVVEQVTRVHFDQP